MLCLMFLTSQGHFHFFLYKRLFYKSIHVGAFLALVDTRGIIGSTGCSFVACFGVGWVYGLYGFRCSLVLTYVAPLSAFILYERYPRYSLTLAGCQVFPGGVMYITLVPVGRMFSSAFSWCLSFIQRVSGVIVGWY